MNRSLRQKSGLPDRHNDLRQKPEHAVLARLRRSHVKARAGFKRQLLDQAVALWVAIARRPSAPGAPAPAPGPPQSLTTVGGGLISSGECQCVGRGWNPRLTGLLTVTSVRTMFGPVKQVPSAVVVVVGDAGGACRA